MADLMAAAPARPFLNSTCGRETQAGDDRTIADEAPKGSVLVVGVPSPKDSDVLNFFRADLVPGQISITAFDPFPVSSRRLPRH